jgi:hypothetical protein
MTVAIPGQGRRFIPIRLARVKANGRRFIIEAIEGSKVRVKGGVNQVSGWSALHGPNMVFLVDRVDILEVDYSQELLEELLKESHP